MRYQGWARGTRSGSAARVSLLFFGALLAEGAWAPARAAITQSINYQGFLTSKATGLPIDGSAIVNLSIFAPATGGTPLFSDCRTLTVSKGRYEVAIGSTTGGVPTSVLAANATTYLEVDVANSGGACPAYVGSSLQVNWEALSPRIQLQSSPYSFVTAAMPVTFSSVTVIDSNASDTYSFAVTTDSTLGIYHLVVATSGNVGIGISNPAGTGTQLFVNSSGGTPVRWGFQGTTYGALGSGTASSFARVRGEAGMSLSLGAGATNELAVLQPNGSLGIGTTSPASRLHVSSSAVAADVIFRVSSGTSAGQDVFKVNGDGTAVHASSITVNGLILFGAQTGAQIRALACPAIPCAVFNSTDFDMYTATGTGTDQWRNSRTGTGP